MLSFKAREMLQRMKVFFQRMDSSLQFRNCATIAPRYQNVFLGRSTRFSSVRSLAQNAVYTCRLGRGTQKTAAPCTAPVPKQQHTAAAFPSGASTQASIQVPKQHKNLRVAPSSTLHKHQHPKHKALCSGPRLQTARSARQQRPAPAPCGGTSTLTPSSVQQHSSSEAHSTLQVSSSRGTSAQAPNRPTAF